MLNKDTVQLLSETDKGVQMAIYSFDQLLEHIQNPALKKIITDSRNDHKRLKDEVENLIKAHHLPENAPPAMAKGMAWMESHMKMEMDYDDSTAAEIISKGCSMGARNLQKYINDYAEADITAADVAKKLIVLENKLEEQLKLYL